MADPHHHHDDEGVQAALALKGFRAACVGTVKEALGSGRFCLIIDNNGGVHAGLTEVVITDPMKRSERGRFGLSKLSRRRDGSGTAEFTGIGRVFATLAPHDGRSAEGVQTGDRIFSLARDYAAITPAEWRLGCVTRTYPRRFDDSSKVCVVLEKSLRAGDTVDVINRRGTVIRGTFVVEGIGRGLGLGADIADPLDGVAGGTVYVKLAWPVESDERGSSKRMPHFKEGDVIGILPSTERAESGAWQHDG